MREKVLIFGAVFLCLLSGYPVSAQGEESISVSCYVGDPDDNHQVGDVEVFTGSVAAGTCNTVYDDCKGNCTGCYISEDGSQICIDATGRRYTRQ
ncbi:MAG TPA: hypothetical protein VFG09_01980 [Thermodesulfovibrionales bacterium]|jgi:hypothetical protein|nr:hypothetical protein [Thermodesulfovibrionales bacterium]